MLTSSSEAATLNAALRGMLLAVAGEAIRHGLAGKRHVFRAADFPAPLSAARASFVTLYQAAPRGEQRLRGCIGSLEATRTLVEDVAHNAYAAAFKDPRFPPLTSPELEKLDLHIAVLSVPQPMRFTSEADLLAQLCPGVDGLLLQDNSHRGTFLPAVWKQVASVEEFWTQLKLKAGLPADYWSGTLTVKRYTVESFP